MWYQHLSPLHKRDKSAPIYVCSYSIFQRKIRFEDTFTSSLYNAHGASALHSRGPGFKLAQRWAILTDIFYGSPHSLRQVPE
jgi:hypothetical protein